MLGLRCLVPIALCLTLGVLPACNAKPPEPVRVVAFLDASSSSVRLRPQMTAFLEDFVGRLDRHLDKLVVYRLAATVGLIYSGEAWRGPALRNNLAAYIKEPARKGTSYGAALERAAQEARGAEAEKRRPVILLLGDAADEPGPGCKNIDRKALPGLVRKMGESAILAFVFADPTDKFSDTFTAFQDAFGASYDERLQFSTPESEARHTVRNFLLAKLKR
ncbi:MAG: VWA domain-containing protein [Candidatus Sericytochromatia bacterium]|uniref:VWA domain-containing protein n=1 Tax=Candidatus Tanganyikabacteria bacterium TaxID=2961651 RepID=A0A938BJI3_9BACT|nr:VWA domain-containing protein [Candidatus Tanganyikabacteria bacterium]